MYYIESRSRPFKSASPFNMIMADPLSQCHILPTPLEAIKIEKKSISSLNIFSDLDSTAFCVVENSISSLTFELRIFSSSQSHLTSSYLELQNLKAFVQNMSQGSMISAQLLMLSYYLPANNFNKLYSVFVS